MEDIAMFFFWAFLLLSIVYGGILIAAQTLAMAYPDKVKETTISAIRRLLDKLLLALAFLSLGIFGGYDMALNDGESCEVAP